ncbi:MAG: ribonuclease HIII [Tenericutes bacterium]|nr:ribonuclease HIII [Mycoplasmatota bacterium]
MNKQKTIVFKISDNIRPQMVEYYDLLRKDKNPPYSVFQAEEGGTVITLYESGKVMFQGISADVDANMWKDLEKHINNRDINIESKEKEKVEDDKSYYYYDAIGSDEVGTGDYFGPIIVTATLVNKNTRKLLEDLKIMDSKKMTDEKIMRCAPIIMKKIPYVTFLLSNKKYNELSSKGFNMNKIKAVLHNKVLYELSNKGLPYHKIIVDQFTTPRSYFSYLKQENINEKVTKITFLTKGESKHLSVAAASVISRFIFLEEISKLSDKYKMNILKGASDKVDNVARQIVEKYGEKELNNIVKLNFKNTNKILEK